jgi:ABC-type dipeptide/oligopeptide/nickel transport system ATPase component
VEFVAECNPRVVLMKEGQIVADGVGKEILTDPKMLELSSIVLPQIAQVFTKLADWGCQKTYHRPLRSENDCCYEKRRRSVGE